MKLSADEAAGLHPWLDWMRGNLRSTGKWEPLRNATSWDAVDLYLSLLEEMRDTPMRVATLVTERAATGRWPKMPQSDRFWMRARFEWAIAASESVLAQAGHKPPPKCLYRPPTDVPAGAMWLLQESWDALGAPWTLMRRIDDWVFEDPWTEPDQRDWWGEFEERVKRGDFLHEDPMPPPRAGFVIGKGRNPLDDVDS